MLRAYYGIAAATWDAKPLPDAVETGRAAGQVYLLAATDPHPGLDAIGAQRLGKLLTELDPNALDACTRQLVERKGELLTLRQGEPLKLGDVVLGLLPSVVFAGDDPADYL